MRTKTLLRYADNGRWVSHEIPVWVYPVDMRGKGYYTIENGSPREVLSHKTYTRRRRIHFQITGVHTDDVRSRFIKTVYSTVRDSYVYTAGPHANQEVSGEVKICKINAGFNESRSNRYYVVTEEGHINPVATTKLLLKRPQSLQYSKEWRYKKKVKQLQAESQERRSERENKKRKRLDEMIRSIRNRDDLSPESNADVIDHSMNDDSTADTIIQQEPTLKRSITEEQIAEEELVTSHASVASDHFIQDNETTQLSHEETAESAMSVSTSARKSTMKLIRKGGEVNTPSSTAGRDFFEQRQQTLVKQLKQQTLKKAKTQAIVIKKEIDQSKEQTRILSSAHIGVKEKLEKLNKAASIPSKQNDSYPRKKTNLTTGTTLFLHQSGIREEAKRPPVPASNTEAELRKRMTAMKRNSRWSD